ASAFLFGLNRLSQVACVEHEEHLTGVYAFERRFEFQVGDAVQEDRSHGLGVERVARARVTEVLRDQVEPRALRRGVPCEENRHGVLGLSRLNLRQGRRRAGGKRRLGVRQAFEREQYVRLRRLAVEQPDDFDTLVSLQLRLLRPDLIGEGGGVGGGVFQVVLRVGVLVDAEGDDVSYALAPQRLVAGDGQHGVWAFDVVAVEGVSDQAVLSGDDRDLGFERRLSPAIQRVAAPDFDQRAVAEQPHVARAGASRLIRRGRLADLYLHLDRAARRA